MKLFLYGAMVLLISSCSNSLNSDVAKTDEEVMKPKVLKSVVAELKEQKNLTIEEKIAFYHELKSEKSDEYDFQNKDELTMYGYGFLWGGMNEEARQIFQLIVDEWPEWGNAYDSLAESYWALGDEEKAIELYELSVEMDPLNYNGKDMLKRLKDPNWKPLSPETRFQEQHSIEDYRADLDQLGMWLSTVHPAAFKFQTQQEFQELIEEKKALITAETTFPEFYWHCDEIIASIGCSHTDAGSFWKERSMLPAELRFPLELAMVNEKLYLSKENNELIDVSAGTEILSVNGTSTNELMSEIYRHIQSQGIVETSKRHFFNAWFDALIPYAMGFPNEYEIEFNGSPNVIKIAAGFIREPQFNDPTVTKCENLLCFELLGDEGTAVMTISSFNYYAWNNLDVFIDFVDESFKTIKKKGITDLIIDVRQNGGGSPSSAIHLLKYLIDEPFGYFNNGNSMEGNDIQTPFDDNYQGKLYFLIDGQGKSTTGHFMSIVKDRKLGTIIGEELGSNQFCTAGQTIRRLDNTELEIYIANATSYSVVNSIPVERGVLPDVELSASISDHLTGKDRVLDYTLDLIK